MDGGWTLQPVEGDPFAAPKSAVPVWKFEPVEGDPFGGPKSGHSYLPPDAPVGYHQNPLPEAPVDEGNYVSKISSELPEDEADLRLSGQLGAPVATTPGVAHAPTKADKWAATLVAPASDPSDLMGHTPLSSKQDSASPSWGVQQITQRPDWRVQSGAKLIVPPKTEDEASLSPTEYGQTATTPANPHETAVDRVAAEIARGASEGWNGTDTTILPDKVQAKLDDAQRKGGLTGYLAALASTAAEDVKVPIAVWNAAIGAFQKGIVQTGEEVGNYPSVPMGLGDIPAFARDVAALPEAFPAGGVETGLHVVPEAASPRASEAPNSIYDVMRQRANETPEEAAGRQARDQMEAEAGEREAASANQVGPAPAQIAGPEVETPPVAVEPTPTAAPPESTPVVPEVAPEAARPTVATQVPRPTAPETAPQTESEPAHQGVITPGQAATEPVPVPTLPQVAIAPQSTTYQMFDPRDLTLAPKLFQFKAANEQGVTGALTGTAQWEPTLANPITVWQGDDGNNYVVNGHQRTDLALRAQAAGQPNVQMPAQVFREADGYTSAYMRTLGAYQNIAEGSGTAIDAAKVLRGANAIPDTMRLPGLPPKSQLVQQGQALAKLSDDAFGMVVNDVVPAAYAAHVGNLISDPGEQLGAMAVLARADPANSEQARMMVEMARNSGFAKGVQTGLFGDEDFARSLIPERARVLDRAMRSLRQLGGVFKAAVEGEETLTSAGNRMDTASNTQARTENERLYDAIQRNGTVRGPVSDALNRAATDLAAGKPIATVSSRFLAEAGNLVRSGQSEGVQPSADVGRVEPSQDEPGAVDQAAEYREELGPGLFSGHRLPSSGEVITKGDLWKLPREELESMRDDESFSDHGKLVRALGGEDAAKEFNRLDRKQNSSNPDRADEGAREFDVKFGNLTAEQERLIYGIGETGPSVDDIEDVLRAHQTRSSDPEDAAYEAALAMRHVTPAQMMEVPTGQASLTAQSAYVRLRNAYEDMANAGLDSRQIESNILGALIRRGWKEADAREVIGGFIDQMRNLSKASANRLEVGRRLPAPPTAGTDLFGATRAQPTARTPEPTIRTDTRQATLEGMDPSARQAQAASDARGPRSNQQAADEGLFAPAATPQPELPVAPRTSRWPQTAGDNFRDLLNEIRAAGHQTAADFVLQRGLDTGHEHIAVVDNHTGEIVHAGTNNEVNKAGFRGDNGSTEVDRYTLHHNHPNSTALSGGDLMMLANPGISHVVAHGHDGTTTTASLSPKMAENRAATTSAIARNGEALRRASDTAHVLSEHILVPLAKSGAITEEEGDRLYGDIANRLLDAQGLISYQSTVELPSEVKAAFGAALEKLGHGPDVVDRSSGAVRAEDSIARLPAPARGPEGAGNPARGSESAGLSDPRGAAGDVPWRGDTLLEGDERGIQPGLNAGEERTPEQRAAILHNLRNGPLPPREMPNLIDQGPPRPPREPRAATPPPERVLPLSEPPQPDNAPHGNEPPPPESLWGGASEPPAGPLRPPEIEAARITRPQAVKNLNVVENLTIMPQTLAALDEPSARLWNTWQNRARDETVNAGQLRQVITPNFLKLSKPERLHVAGVLEIARIEGEENLFANPDGTITAHNNAISFARWSKVGDALHLTPQETAAYHEAVQLGKDQWTMLMKGAARRYGWGGDIDPAVIRDAANQHGDPGDYKKLNRLADLLDVMRQHEQDVYFPMQRFGSYFIAIRPKTGPDVAANLGGHPPLAWFETVEKPAFQDLFGVSNGRLSVQAVAAKRIEELQKQFPSDKFDIRQGDFARTPGLLRQINIPAVEKLFMLMENKVKATVQDQVMRGDNPPTTKSGVREEAKNRYDELHGSTLEAFYDALFEELKSGYRRKANVVPGYSADFDRAVSSHLYQIARNSADMVHRDGIESAYQSIQDFHQHDNVKKYWKKWRAYQEDPGSALGRAAATMNQIGFTYMLGMNPSSTMIIASHMPMTAAPVLSVGVGPHVAVPAMIRGLKNAYGSLRFDSKHGAHIDLDKAMAGMPPEKQTFLRLMASEGRLAAVGTHDMAALNDKMATLFRGYADTARRGMEIATSNVHAVDQANRFAVASAAWDIASNPAHFNAAAAPLMRHNAIFRDMVQREMGLSRESYGRFMLSQAAFDWGKESQAPLMRGPLGQLMFALHGFQTRYLSRAFNMMKNGGPEGKFGFGLMMAALGLGAGALGLPFSEDAMKGTDATWHHFTGHDPDIKHKIEDAIQDTGMGQLGSDMILHGPLSVLTGVNLGSRVGFGDVLSREFESSNVLGTIPSIAWSAYSGASQRIASNQAGAAIAAEAAPGALRGPLRTYAEMRQGVTSRRGVQQIPPENISGADLTKTALGFQPLNVMHRQEEAERYYKTQGSQEGWTAMIKSGDAENAIKEMAAAGWGASRIKSFIRQAVQPPTVGKQFQRFEQNRGIAPPP